MRPYSKMNPAAVNMYELPYHPMSSMLLKPGLTPQLLQVMIRQPLRPSLSKT